MACYSPLTAWQRGDGTIIFKHHDRDIRRQVELPCGQCIGCRLERSRQWAIRCMHEQQLHEHNAYVTLTYDDEHLPENGYLQHDDFIAFIKRLTRRSRRQSRLHRPTADKTLLGKGTIRYYMCGEYGSAENSRRPHFHACLFGIDFNDKREFKQERGKTLYTSQVLTDTWGKGHATTGDVTFQSAAYIARYVMKKITGKQAKTHYEEIDLTTGELTYRTPEYNQMSRRPGIGKKWFEKYTSDVYPQGKTVVNGHLVNAPRYYDKLYEQLAPELFEETQWTRQKEGIAQAHDNTPERRKDKEVVKQAQIAFLKRTL